MIPEKERNEIIDLLIEKLGSSYSEVPYSEIKQKYDVNRSILLNEILRDLSNQDVIQESGNIFQTAKLLPKGLEIKRNGGWLKKFEQAKRDNERQRVRDEAELENLRHSTKLSKIQIKWFHISLIVVFIGGLCGFLALSLELSSRGTADSLKQDSVEKSQNSKLATDTLSATDTSDSLKKVK